MHYSIQTYLKSFDCVLSQNNLVLEGASNGSLLLLLCIILGNLFLTRKKGFPILYECTTKGRALALFVRHIVTVFSAET